MTATTHESQDVVILRRELTELIARCRRDGHDRDTTMDAATECAARRIEELGGESDRALAFVREVMRTAWPGNGAGGPAQIAPAKIKAKLKFRGKAASTTATSSTTVDKFGWQRRVNSAEGPPDHIARHLGLSVSIYMDGDGRGAFPSQDRLAVDTALTLNTVKKYLRRLAKAGWIKRTKRTDRRGRFCGYQYQAQIPTTSNRGASRDRGHGVTGQARYQRGVK